MGFTYRHTRIACYVGYITQAIINNLSPLLFLTFQKQFSVSLTQISLIITVNFAVQMAVDFFSAHFMDRIGYRVSLVAAHVLSVLGLFCLSMLPGVMAPYAGLMIATVLCAVGGGLLEVLVSPLIEALPSEHKEQEMSLLHSFYCWGHVSVVLLSTCFFLALGIQHWRILPLLWAVVPLLNALLFAKTPMCTLQEAGRALPVRSLVAMPVFWLLAVLMICAGAAEQSVSQWASLFAEEGLRVSKTVGDLLGPCAFAVLMGLSRLLFSRIRMPVEKGMILSGALCVFSYLTVVLSPWPLLSLIGCAVCGFSVGIMWPGTFSLASKHLPSGGTAMFALLALAGDIGCCSGPSLVGAVSDGALSAGGSLLSSLFPQSPLAQTALKTGFLAAVLFPAVLVLGVCLIRRKKT